MKEEYRERFVVAMGIMAENFQKEPSEALAEIYWKVLADMTIDDFERAASVLINTRKITGTFPLIAEIREAAGQGQASIDTRVAIAWDKLMYAVESHGYYDSVTFDDPVIPAILKSWGGWLTWSGNITQDELKWARKDFDKLYRAYAILKLPQEGHCIGQIEHQNELAGFPECNGPVYLIGGEIGAFKSLPLPKMEEPKQIEGGK